MLLAVDVGNTNLTLGLFRERELVASRRARTDPQATPDELELTVSDLLGLDGESLAGISAISCASVVPALDAAIRSLAGRRRILLLMAGSTNVPVSIRVDRPGDVGADRLVNAFAAGKIFGAPAIVVDLGTATKIDAVGSDGAFVGGAIAPGLELGLAALAERTAKLPAVELAMPDLVIGTNTIAAIQSGAVLGHTLLVVGLIERMKSELATQEGIAPERIRTIVTGGLSTLPWVRELPGVDAVEPALTLRGLAMLAERGIERTTEAAQRGRAPSPRAESESDAIELQAGGRR